MTRREMWQALLDGKQVIHPRLSFNYIFMDREGNPIVMTDFMPSGTLRTDEIDDKTYDTGWEIYSPICTREQAIEGLKLGEKWKALDFVEHGYKYTELTNNFDLNHIGIITPLVTPIPILSCNRWQRVYDKGETQ
jgi:hypothetical protein